MGGTASTLASVYSRCRWRWRSLAPRAQRRHTCPTWPQARRLAAVMAAVIAAVMSTVVVVIVVAVFAAWRRCTPLRSLTPAVRLVPVEAAMEAAAAARARARAVGAKGAAVAARARARARARYPCRATACRWRRQAQPGRGTRGG